MSLLQQHKHSSYCKRGRTCRFNFPHPPSTKTLIAYPRSDEDDDSIDMNTVSNALSRVRKELIDGNVDVHISIEQLLNNAKVPEDMKVLVHVILCYRLKSIEK